MHCILQNGRFLLGNTYKPVSAAPFVFFYCKVSLGALKGTIKCVITNIILLLLLDLKKMIIIKKNKFRKIIWLLKH